MKYKVALVGSCENSERDGLQEQKKCMEIGACKKGKKKKGKAKKDGWLAGSGQSAAAAAAVATAARHLALFAFHYRNRTVFDACDRVKSDGVKTRETNISDRGSARPWRPITTPRPLFIRIAQ